MRTTCARQAKKDNEKKICRSTLPGAGGSESKENDMRMSKALGLAALLAGALTACGSGNGGATVDTSTAPGTLIEDPPLRVASLSAAALTAQFDASTAGQQLLQLAGTPKCGIDFHYIQYQTVGGAGEQTTASGALMVPTGPGCTGARSIVIYAHGTATTKGYDIADITDQTNEAWSESALIAAMFAAQGYIVVAPNYAGYDSSTLPYHPYLNAVQQSTDMIDALTAARTAIPSVAGGSLSDGGKLFITGYSQGGFVALATHKAMQAAGMTVTASAPMSGPYAMEAFGDAILFGDVDLGATVFLPLITESYQHTYGNLYNATSDIYSSTYATGIDTLLPSTAPIDTLFAQGKLPELALFDSTTPVTGNATLDAELAVPANPLFAQGFGNPFEILDSVRVAYALDAAASPDGAIAGVTGAPLATAPQYPLRVALKKNDLRSWTPDGTAPILLCGGHDDPTVFYSINTQTMESFWAAQVAGGLVTPIDVDPGIAFASGGIATQVATIAATVLATDLGGGVTNPTRIGTDIETAIIGTFPAYFTITAQGAKPNSSQGVLVEEIAATAAQTAGAELAAGVTSPTTVGTAITTAIIQSYHGTLVPPACTLAARTFFANF